MSADVPPPAPGAAPSEAEDAEEAEGLSDMLLDSVTKDEWKAIEASLSYSKKAVAEMLKRACSHIRTKGELALDDSNGKFLGDMLPEMENFATWCYKEHVRPKLVSLPLALPDEEEEGDGKKKGKGGGGKKGGGGGKGKGGKGKNEISAKVQIKIDNVMRIMAGEAAKDKGKKTQIGDRAVGWLEVRGECAPCLAAARRRGAAAWWREFGRIPPGIVDPSPPRTRRRSSPGRTSSSTPRGRCTWPRRWARRRRY